jgi:hypothetical protein
VLLIAQTITNRRLALLLAAGLAVMAPVHLLTHYGNEQYDYISPGELAGFEQAAGLAPANIYGAYPAGRFLNTARLDTRNATVPRGEEVPRLADYEFPSAMKMTLFYDQPQFMAEVLAMLRSNPEFEPVYSNDDISIFRWRGTATAAGAPTP